MRRSMNIGQAADAAGVSAKMIRHYEQIGLMPSPSRSDSGYRQYDERDVSVLRFIRQSRGLGFSTQQIADLIGLWSNTGRASRTVKAMAQQHLADIEEKMREMVEMKQALERLVAACHGDDHPHCAILDELAGDSAPAPRTTSTATTRMSAAKKRAPKTPPEARPSSNAHLMAWTNSLLTLRPKRKNRR